MSKASIRLHAFLAEIQAEDIPVRFLKRVQAHLHAGVRKMLEEAEMGSAEPRFQVWLTPRRIALWIADLPEATPRRQVTVFGPKEDTVKDGLGRFTDRAQAFSKGHGIPPDELRLENGRLAYAKTIAPRKVVEILKEKIPDIVLTAPFAKTMRWPEGGERRYGRPLRGVAAFWDKKLLRDWRWVPGVVPNAFTRVGTKIVKISDAAGYEKKLRASGLILDPVKKRQSLQKELERKIHGFTHENEALLEEILASVEVPRVAVGSFNPEYLKLPEDVVAAILAKVKLLALARAGRLVNRFISIVEAPSRDRFLKNIQAGYERVAAAKLFDAKFFWDQDFKKPLAFYAEKLKGILFSKEMGSLWDKTARVERIASALASDFRPKPDLEIVAKAAILYKADLATSLVGEYPDLAGKVGYHYARLQGEDEQVCRAIAEVAEFAPGQASPAGAVLALAERLDTLLAQFALGSKPTATEDPLGLKRLADSAIEVFWQKRCDCSLRHAIDSAWETFGNFSKDPRKDLLDYFRSRLVLHARNNGFAIDRIEAVLAGSRFQDLYAGDIADCLAAFKNLEKNQPETVASAVQSFKRIANILKQAQKMGEETGGLVDQALFAHSAESDLWKKIGKSLESFEDAVKRSAYEAAFEEVAGFAAPLEVFFNSVMVLTDDVKIKQNRLALLRQIHRMVLQIMDPAKLVLADSLTVKRETENVKT